MQSKYKIGDRLLVSTPAEESFGIKAAIQDVFAATEIRILEYSLCEQYVKVELAETSQAIWWRVDNFPPFLAHLSNDDPQDSRLSPLEELLLSRRQLAYGEYCVASNDSRIMAMAFVQMPIMALKASDLDIETGQVKVRNTGDLQTFLASESFNRGLQDVKILGVYPDISSP